MLDGGKSQAGVAAGPGWASLAGDGRGGEFHGAGPSVCVSIRQFLRSVCLCKDGPTCRSGFVAWQRVGQAIVSQRALRVGASGLPRGAGSPGSPLAASEQGDGPQELALPAATLRSVCPLLSTRVGTQAGAAPGLSVRICSLTRTRSPACT